MPDARFFANVGPFTLERLAILTRAALSQTADPPRLVHDVAPLDAAGEREVSFLDNVKYLPVFEASKAGACFARPKFAARAPEGMVLLLTEEPYLAFAQVCGLFYPEPKTEPRTSPGAHISPSAAIGPDCRIEPGAVIEDHVTLGARCVIGANAVIHRGVTIGNDSRIGACCTVSHALIGDRVVIHRGTHIGQDGFGFAPGKQGIVKVPQLGRVVIGDDVEIGAGTCIDRGAGPDTIIDQGSKIDNLVQIGHNVRIGRHVVIAGQAGIAGSTRIGDGVMLGGQAGIAGHVTLGAGSKLAAQAGAMTDIPAGAAYGGSPAIAVKDWHRQTATLAKLSKRKESNDE